MKGKILTISCIFALAFCFISNVSALEMDVNAGSEEEQRINTIVSERKMNSVYNFIDSRENQPITRGGGGYHGLRSNYSLYKQDYWYYCGPASVQQVINYITGTLRTQSFYANELQTKSDGSGSYVYLVKNTLNKYQSRHNYSYKQITTDDKSMTPYVFLAGMMNTINEDSPVILHARGEALYMYNGHKNGHYITVTGVYEDYLDIEFSKFTYADTNVSDWGRGNTFGIFEDDLLTMYNSLRSNGRYVIW